MATNISSATAQVSAPSRSGSEMALNYILVNVLENQDDSPIVQAFEYFGIRSIDDFLIIRPQTDLKNAAFKYTVASDESNRIAAVLSVVQIRKLELLQDWYREQEDPSVDTWFELSARSFKSWMTRNSLQQISPINSPSESFQPMTPGTQTSFVQPSSMQVIDSEAVLFKKGTKRSVSDYNKLKDDSKWKQWKRHLKAMANSHGTANVLDPKYQPQSNSEHELFTAQNDFMYSVFEQCLLTAKSKLQVQLHEDTMNAQKVYIGLLNVYEKDLSGELHIGDLRSELTVMRLTDNWRGSYESFLNHWNTKVLDLERTQDKEVDHETKRLWLTNTLETQVQMKSAIDQAIVTESTITGLAGTTSTKLPWENFFLLVMNQAKLIDRQKKSAKSTKRESNKAQRSNTKKDKDSKKTSDNSKSQNSSDSKDNSSKRQWTKYTGPDMVMKPHMFFKRQDYFKLTQDQKTQLKRLHEQAKNSTSPNTTIASTYNVNTSNTTPSVPSSDYQPDSSIRQLLSNRAARSSNSEQPGVNFQSPPVKEIIQNGHKYRIVNMADTHYHVGNSKRVSNQGSLIDGGANGGMAGKDVKVIEETFQKVNVTGIADNTIEDIPIGTVAGLITTTRGPIIGIFHQYAIVGKGKTIHSSNQLKSFGVQIDDTPRKLKGSQCIKHPDGYVIPLSIRNGLPYMDMKCPSDEEMDEYPHVIFTSDTQWDPDDLNDEYSLHEVEEVEDDNFPSFGPHDLSDYGEILSREQYFSETMPFDEYIDLCLYQVKAHYVTPKQHDFERLQPNFGFVPPKRIQKTLENTTQFCRQDMRFPLRKHYKSRFPAANVSRLNEVVATDTFFSDVPAHDDGIMGHGGTTEVQLYCGTKSLLTSAHPMKSESEMSNTLLDFIRKYGAPNGLFSDNAKAQTSKAVHQILRMYAIDDFQCEPHHQHQNPAERRIQDVKKMTNTLMDRTGTPSKFWLLCLLYTVYVLNRLSTESLNWKTPLESAFGQKPDISALLAFRWWEPIYYSTSNSFPNSKELTGKIVGIAEHQGDTMTWLVLDDISQKVIARSAVRTALNPNSPNLRADFNSDGGESPVHKPIISTSDVIGHTDPSSFKLPKFSPDELIGLTFLRETDDGQTLRAQIVRKILDNDAANHERIKFLVTLGDGEFDEIITYNELSSIIDDQHSKEINDPDAAWSFLEIKGHTGPLNSTHPDYKGSSYNVLVHWEDGSETYEPLDIMIKDDPVTLAKYALDHDLLEVPGWKRLRRIAKNQKKLQRMLKQAKLSQSRQRKGPIYMFGVQVPRNEKEAYELDKKNGNSKWQDAMTEEIKSLNQYDTFQDKGKIPFLNGYKRISVHFVYAVKHDLRHKARLVAGGHMTDAPDQGSYSSVVSLRSIRIALVAAELNGLETMVGDISSAYLEAFTKEKVCFKAGPSFGELEGHLLIIVKALYGLRTSGASWHQRFADTLRDMGFKPCKADPDVWMRDCMTHYEYVCVYVDDIMHMSKNPQLFFDELKEKYQYNLKGVGRPTYHLGGDFVHDKDGTLAWGAKSYVKKMLAAYEVMFQGKPKEYSSPMAEGDHPELDNSEEMDIHGIKQYQSLIGALQWAITLGRLDLLAGVATMSSFRVAPRKGHLHRLKRMYGYLKRNPDAAIRFRVGIPNHEEIGEPAKFDWITSVYGPITEELPQDMPIPRGKFVRTTTYQDANLMHDLVTGRSMTGILHILNQTPIQWFSKKQNVVETATYGSEFMAARQAVEQIMDLRYTLRMMGIPLDGPSWMFGDNQSVLTSSTIPHSSLNKRHNALSYHRVREAIAAGIINFMHVDGKANPSDVLTKFLGWNKFWPLVQPILFWKGETMKHVPHDLPLPEIIKETIGKSPSGLRGVSNTSDINH